MLVSLVKHKHRKCEYDCEYCCGVELKHLKVHYEGVTLTTEILRNGSSQPLLIRLARQTLTTRAHRLWCVFGSLLSGLWVQSSYVVVGRIVIGSKLHIIFGDFWLMSKSLVQRDQMELFYWSLFTSTSLPINRKLVFIYITKNNFYSCT
jgi:hypothetical protein